MPVVLAHYRIRTLGQLRKCFQCKIAIIFLFISLNMCFGCEIRKLIFRYASLSGGGGLYICEPMTYIKPEAMFLQCYGHMQTKVMCIKGLFWDPYEADKNLLSTNFFLLLYKKNYSPRVKCWCQFEFYRCYGNENCHRNRMKIEK